MPPRGILHVPGLNRNGRPLHSLAKVEASRMGAAHPGESGLAPPLHPRHCLHHPGAHGGQTLRDRDGVHNDPHSPPRLLHLHPLETETNAH